MSSKKKDYKDYVHEHERRFHPFAGYCWGCHKSIRACDVTCPNCGAALQERPRRFPQKPEKLSTKVFEDEKESTLPTSTPKFEFEFGGFKQLESLTTQSESSILKGEIVNGNFTRKYPSEVGKLCKNIFPDEKEKTKK